MENWDLPSVTNDFGNMGIGQGGPTMNGNFGQSNNIPLEPVRRPGFGRGRGAIAQHSTQASQATGPPPGVFGDGSSTSSQATTGRPGFGRGRGSFQTNSNPPNVAMSQNTGFSKPSEIVAPSFAPSNFTANGRSTFGASSSNAAESSSRGGGGFANPSFVTVTPKPKPSTAGGPPDWSMQLPRNERDEENLFSGCNTGISFDLYDNIPVSVKGSNAAPGAERFAELRVHPFLMDNIRLCKYDRPTPVQKHGLPSALAGRDLMACAQTGSGKTAAYLIPIVNYILTKGQQDYIPPEEKRGVSQACQYPLALVLAPTRELSLQIYNEAVKFCYRTCVKPRMMYGGRENYNEQLYALRNGCHILIGTPGRITDILEKDYLSLRSVKFFVLDEADRMLDMGFVPQIKNIVNYELPAKGTRQTMMFSATFPTEIQRLAMDFLVSDYIFLTIGRVGSTSENIEQRIWRLDDEQSKRDKLLSLLIASDKQSLSLVFVETKRNAADLAYALTRANFPAVPIHGDLQQFERERNLKEFRSGNKPILVATAVAARGLDIPHVKQVINFDIPSDIDEYVHRIGRTGRVGNKGLAISFFAHKDRFLAADLLKLLKESNQEVPSWLVDMANNPSNDPRNNTRNFRGRSYGGRSSYASAGGSMFASGGSGGGFSHSNSSPSFAASSSNPKHEMWVPKSAAPASSNAAANVGFSSAFVNVPASSESAKMDWW